MHMPIGLSIQHDASHGALSKNPNVNAFFAYGIDAIGSSRWIWLQSHIMRHHPYTNQHGLDMDAGSAEPFLLFHNYPAASSARKWFHAFQAWYTHMVLGLYGVSMVYNPQYLFRMQHSETIPESTTAVHPEGFLRGYRAMAIFLRMFYIFRIAFLPWYLCGVSPLITLPLVPTATGAFLTFVFVLSHNFEGSERVPEKKCVVDQQGKVIDSEKQAPAQEGGDKIDWYRAQAETSSTYGGKIAMMMTGGLNLQIEHHLFPRMSSWHYPTIQQAVKDACARHGVRYAYYPTIQENIVSTLRYMRKAGVAEALSHAQSELS
jgi:fatty acid desaturase (delta-4 desaturase)